MESEMTQLEYMVKEVLYHGDTNPNCMEWPFFRDKGKYGRVYKSGRTGLVHRFAYELVKGDIPDGFEVDHECHNPPCFNPRHLNLLSIPENRKKQRPRTHCPKGHLYSADNIMSGPWLRCKTCNRAYNKKYRLKHKAKVL